ncbi:MAG: hypothetical protein AB7O45_13415 [Alphaproteobacteria bacterium]
MTLVVALAAGGARADIQVVNQTTVPIWAQFSNPAEPGSTSAAVMCTSVSVPRESTATATRGAACTDKATVRAVGPRLPTNTHAECRIEGLPWSGAQVVVTGSLYSLTCAQ